MRSEEEVREMLKRLLVIPREFSPWVQEEILWYKATWIAFLGGGQVVGALLWVLGYVDAPFDFEQIKRGLMKFLVDNHEFFGIPKDVVRQLKEELK